MGEILSTNHIRFIRQQFATTQGKFLVQRGIKHKNFSESQQTLEIKSANSTAQQIYVASARRRKNVRA